MRGVEETEALGALAGALRRLAEGASLDDALRAMAEAVSRAARAEVAVIRVLDETGAWLEARAVAASSTSVAAQLQGSRAVPSPNGGEGARATGQRLGLNIALELPIALEGRELGRLELMRRSEPFTATDEAVARLAADHAAVALAANENGVAQLSGSELLRLGGDALATGLDERRTAEQIARLAAQGTGAVGASVWRLEDDLQPYVVGGFGSSPTDPRAVTETLRSRKFLSVGPDRWVVQLGQPAFGALELAFEEPFVPADDVLDSLTTYAARAAHALRTTERAHRESVELERSRAVIAVVGQAIAQLSLAHTLETAVERVADLLDADRLAVYPQRGRTITHDELALVTALAAQLAVVVQNARLHEQAMRRESERREALEAEQEVSRRLGSLYQISRTFAHSPPLETTLEALVRTFAELLGLDAVGVRMPDERGEVLVTRALHVRDERLTEALKTIML